MIEIKHKDTGKVLRQVVSRTLEGANLKGANLDGAKLNAVNLAGANLSGAGLRRAYLENVELPDADLSRCRLNAANLIEAVLMNTNLTDADLSGAKLSGAIMQGANLARANLAGANLSEAYLVDANLTDACLVDADLRGAILKGSVLNGAAVGDTRFEGCSTLTLARGLQTLQHVVPSNFELKDIRASVNHLPDVFLQGCGYTLEEISTFRALYGKPIQLFSCFLSYARKDASFVDRLRTDLLAQNVTCWQDVHDMVGGDYWRAQIDQGIKHHDKLVLICSKRSVLRPAVVEEIITAIETEKATGEKKLFPLRLDAYILGDEMTQLAREKTTRGEWGMNWVSYVRAYHIPDFSKWKQHDAYQVEFQKLLKALKAKAG